MAVDGIRERTKRLLDSSLLFFPSKRDSLALLLFGLLLLISFWQNQRLLATRPLLLLGTGGGLPAGQRTIESDTIMAAGQDDEFTIHPDYTSFRCGLPWNEFFHDFREYTNTNAKYKRHNHHKPWTTTTTSPIVWTVSGGPEYKLYLDILLTKWNSLLGFDVLVVALDAETAQRSCELGNMATYWDLPQQSYSKVADSKFQVARELAGAGLDQLFVELDIFCIASPLPLFLQHPEQHVKRPKVVEEAPDLVLLGHGDVQHKINIGMYYVKASNRTSAFFHTLTEILQPSASGEQYLRDRRDNRRSYFDQDVFHDCLEGPSRRTRYYAMHDTNLSHNLIRDCSDHLHPLSWSVISNLQISSYRPPVVHDSTYCIHPLAMSPFSSFRTKLATGKYLGFDPVDARTDHRFMLKTFSGDLTPTENWSTGFFARDFVTNSTRQRTGFQIPIATLVYLAWKTNRVLVLPRTVVDKTGHTYPTYSLVSTASIEKWVPWRFLTSREAREKEQKTQHIMEVPDKGTVDEVHQLVEETCKDFQLCSIHGMFRFSSSQDLHPMIHEIIGNLTWCLTSPGRYHNESFSFGMGQGGFQHPCESTK